MYVPTPTMTESYITRVTFISAAEIVPAIRSMSDNANTDIYIAGYQAAINASSKQVVLFSAGCPSPLSERNHIRRGPLIPAASSPFVRN